MKFAYAMLCPTHSETLCRATVAIWCSVSLVGVGRNLGRGCRSDTATTSFPTDSGSLTFRYEWFTVDVPLSALSWGSYMVDQGTIDNTTVYQGKHWWQFGVLHFLGRTGSSGFRHFWVDPHLKVLHQLVHMNGDCFLFFGADVVHSQVELDARDASLAAVLSMGPQKASNLNRGFQWFLGPIQVMSVAEIPIHSLMVVWGSLYDPWDSDGIHRSDWSFGRIQCHMRSYMAARTLDKPDDWLSNLWRNNLLQQIETLSSGKTTSLLS